MKCQSCAATLSGPVCEYCDTICEAFLEKDISQKLKGEQGAPTAGTGEQKLEELQNAYKGTGASIESEREQMLYDFLRREIGLLKFFVGDRKLLPTEVREEVLRSFSIPEAEKPIAFADTSLSAIFKNARKTGLVFGLNGIYTHDKKFTASMPYETFKKMDIRVKSTFLKEYVEIGSDFRVNLRGQIHSNITKSLQALQQIV